MSQQRSVSLACKGGTMIDMGAEMVFLQVLICRSAVLGIHVVGRKVIWFETALCFTRPDTYHRENLLNSHGFNQIRFKAVD